MPQPSELTAQPRQVPIDWFDPIYWNTYLTVRERASYMKNGTYYVAMPLEEFCKTWEQCAGWKNLPEKEFMEKYGNAVLEKYTLPTEEELKQLEHWENDEEEEDGDEGDSDDDSDD